MRKNTKTDSNAPSTTDTDTYTFIEITDADILAVKELETKDEAFARQVNDAFKAFGLWDKSIKRVNLETLGKVLVAGGAKTPEKALVNAAYINEAIIRLKKEQRDAEERKAGQNKAFFLFLSHWNDFVEGDFQTSGAITDERLDSIKDTLNKKDGKDKFFSYLGGYFKKTFLPNAANQRDAVDSFVERITKHRNLINSLTLTIPE